MTMTDRVVKKDKINSGTGKSNNNNEIGSHSSHRQHHVKSSSQQKEASSRTQPQEQDDNCIASDTFLKRYKIIEKIGEGSYSQVLKCQNKLDGTVVACKRLKHIYKSLDDVTNISEIATLRTIQKHSNILQMIEIHYDKVLGKVSLVFELMDINLYELIKDRKRLLPESRVRTILFQLFKALRHLHKLGVFHRDIKPENILIKAKTDQLKLGDLGSVRGMFSRPPYTEYISTRWYRSPECLLTAGHYSHKMDIWAAGCVFYEVLTLRPLFPGSSEIDQINRINNVLGPPPMKLLETFQKQAELERDTYRGQSQLSRRQQIQKVLNNYSSRYMVATDSSSKNSLGYRKNSLEFHFSGKEGTGLEKILPTHISREAKDLIKSCLLYDPEQRPTAQRIVQLSYFSELRENYSKNPEKVSSKSVVLICGDTVTDQCTPVELTTLGDHKIRYKRGPSQNTSATKGNTSKVPVPKKSESIKSPDINNNTRHRSRRRSSSFTEDLVMMAQPSQSKLPNAACSSGSQLKVTEQIKLPKSGSQEGISSSFASGSSMKVTEPIKLPKRDNWEKNSSSFASESPLKVTEPIKLKNRENRERNFSSFESPLKVPEQIKFSKSVSRDRERNPSFVGESPLKIPEQIKFQKSESRDRDRDRNSVSFVSGNPLKVPEQIKLQTNESRDRERNPFLVSGSQSKILEQIKLQKDERRDRERNPAFISEGPPKRPEQIKSHKNESRDRERNSSSFASRSQSKIPGQIKLQKNQSQDRERNMSSFVSASQVKIPEQIKLQNKENRERNSSSFGKNNQSKVPEVIKLQKSESREPSSSSFVSGSQLKLTEQLKLQKTESRDRERKSLFLGKSSSNRLMNGVSEQSDNKTEQEEQFSRVVLAGTRMKRKPPLPPPDAKISYRGGIQNGFRDASPEATQQQYGYYSVQKASQVSMTGREKRDNERSYRNSINVSGDSAQNIKEASMKKAERIRSIASMAGRENRNNNERAYRNYSVNVGGESTQNIKESSMKKAERLRNTMRDDVFCSSDDDVVISMRKKFDILISERARKLSESLKSNTNSYANESVRNNPPRRRARDSDEDSIVVNRRLRNSVASDKSRKLARRELRARMAESLTTNNYPFGDKWRLSDMSEQAQALLENRASKDKGDWMFANPKYRDKPSDRINAACEEEIKDSSSSILRGRKNNANADNDIQEGLKYKSTKRIHPYIQDQRVYRRGQIFTPPVKKPSSQSPQLGTILYGRQLRYTHNNPMAVSGEYKNNLGRHVNDVDILRRIYISNLKKVQKTG